MTRQPRSLVPPPGARGPSSSRRALGLAVALGCLPLLGANCPELPFLTPPGDGDGDGDGDGNCADGSFSVATAEAYEAGTEVTGYLCPVRDADYWRFTVPSSGSLAQIRVWMDTNLTPVEPSYSILNEDDTPTGISLFDEGRTAGEAPDFTGLHRMGAAGDYILKIADNEGFDDRFDDANPYHLQIDFFPDPDPNEVNDTPADATPLATDTTVTGLIGTSGDEDWFALPIEADAQLVDVQFRAPLDIGLDLAFEVYAPNALTVVDRREARAGDVEYEAQTRVALAGVPGDVYYIRVFDQGGGANVDPTTGSYQLVATVTANPDPNEVGGGNDFIPDATVLPPDTMTSGTLASIGDQDLFLVTPPADASPSNPYVLLVDVTFSGGVPDQVQPQLRVLTHNPERDTPPPCDDTCTACIPLGNGSDACGREYLQRVLTQRTSYSTGFPIRRTRPLVIALNDFGDDQWQDGTGYTLTYRIEPDPDVGEAGDDYIIPNLQTATYDNQEELQNQYYQSRQRARNINVAFQEACEPPGFSVVDGGVVLDTPPDPCADAGVPDDGGAGCVPPPPPNCQAVIPVPSFQGAPMEPYTVACNGQDWTVHAEGRLAYEGDRDFFRFDVPDVGYWGLDVTYDVSASTPVELTVFVHDSDKLIGAWLEAQETPSNRPGGCLSSADCNPGSTCIDEKCWADNDTNPAFANHEFPSPDQCLYVHTNFTERPLYVEVTDNGINDFDLDMEYSLDIRIRCGCPTACDSTGPAPQCQGVGPPAP